MDGVLDARFDMVPVMPAVQSQHWLKFTIAAFRFKEVMEHFEDEGWCVKPLLVVRDMRSVFNSLIKKEYGKNGTTAEDPPIRMRLRRFFEDWQLFREKGWPMLRFESLVADGAPVLQSACQQMDLPWDEGMIHWKKDESDIAAAGYGNETFLINLNTSLEQSIDPTKQGVATQNIPPADLEWMERQFAEFNKAMDYPEHVAPQGPPSPQRAIPDFQFTRRYARIARQRPVMRFCRKLAGSPLLNEKELQHAIGISRQ
jgi:hypothetical protein